jgi:hypothetical protein
VDGRWLGDLGVVWLEVRPWWNCRTGEIGYVLTFSGACLVTDVGPNYRRDWDGDFSDTPDLVRGGHREISRMVENCAGRMPELPKANARTDRPGMEIFR